MNSEFYRKTQFLISNMFKIKNLLFFILFLLPITAFSQVDRDSTSSLMEIDDNLTYIVVEKMPRFKGCEEVEDENQAFECTTLEFRKFLSKNIIYPKTAREANVEGVVYVYFVVDNEGNVRNAIVKKGLGFGCDEEAVRVVNMLPKFAPGTQKGIPVDIPYNLPVPFKPK